MRGLMCWAALLLITAVPLKANSQDATQESATVTPRDWQLTQFNDHIMLCDTPVNEWPGFYFIYDDTGEPAPWKKIPGGGVLHEAAHYYALLTKDYDVSLNEIITAGLWPYNTFPAGTDLDQRLNWPDGHFIGIWDETNNCPLDEPRIGSNRWLLETRASILAAFYADYYYTIIDTTHERSQQIGERYAQFWTNPYTGTLMNAADGNGDLRLYPVTAWRSEVSTREPDLAGTKYEVKLCSYEDFVRLIDGQNDPGSDTIKYSIDLSTMECVPPLDRVVSGSCRRSDLASAFHSLTASLGFGLLHEDLQRQGKLDFDFSVPQLNITLWQQYE